jgi:putative hydrolase of the HAD superfamily
MKAELTAVLFDIDDTLFDRQRAQQEMSALIVREFPDLFAGIDERAVRDAFLESDRISAELPDWQGNANGARLGRSRIFLEMLGLAQDAAPEITTLYVTAYPRIFAPVQDAQQVVRQLSSRFRLSVVSNGIPDVQYTKIETLGIRHLFACILLSGEIGISKPDPRIFWQAARALNVEPQACLHVGNSYEDDVVGSKQAGMWACWLNPSGRQLAIKPDIEIRTLAELLPILSEGQTT